MTVYLFPGQGSQKVGMGNDLFRAFPDITNQANDIVGYSIEKLCLEDPEQQLSETQYTQPALYTVNYLSYLKKLQETELKPNYTAGHSLGEYNALLAAEVFDFASGLELVKKRGELMSQASGGAMAAIIGLTPEQIQTVLSDNDLQTIDIANYNSPKQTVISGPKADISNAQQHFETAGARRYVILNVSGAFHSRYMQDIQKEFKLFLSEFEFAAPSIPVVSNVTALPYSGTDTIENLAQQLTSSVKWTDTIKYLLAQKENTFEEIGPGKVLTSLLRQIQT